MSIRPIRPIACIAIASLSLLSPAYPTLAAEPAKSAAPALRDPATPISDLQARCTAAADYSAKNSGRVVLVMLDGKVVFERADNGWTIDRAHPLASGTKSFVGVTAMRAVQDGLITLDELASDTITEWKSDPRKSKITVRHLLTLSSGLDPGDALLGGRGGSRILGQGAADRAKRLGDEKERPNNNFTAAIGVPAVAAAGEKFAYGPSHFYAFGELLERKLRARAKTDPAFGFTTFDAYMKAKVFDPIGMKVAHFGKDASGHQNLPGGAMLVAREWAKFGQLVLQEGQWSADGKPHSVVDWNLLKQCFEPSANNPSYGLTWWLLTSQNPESSLVADGPLGEMLKRKNQQRQTDAVIGPDGQPLKVYMAAGLGKQRLLVIPAYKMVVVRFAEATREGRGYDDRAFLLPLLEARNAKPE